MQLRTEEIDLKAADLRYVSDEEPGYTRLRWGQGFTYRDADGETVTDSDLRRWFESLAIPPAWEDVWISAYRNGHLLATGRDSKDRKQYIYHPRWQELRNQTKFHQLADFGKALPWLRQAVEADLRKRGIVRERVLALAVRLLEETLIRIGNDAYTQANTTYGLTTLRDKHVNIDGQKITFAFVGKSGKEHQIELKDKQLARIVKACRDIPGYDLFQYYNADGQRQRITSGDVNAYIREITGRDFTAKDFRTWGATTRALSILSTCESDPCEDEVRACVQQVADELGNTVAVCRKYYIYPALFDAFLEGQLPKLLKRVKPKDDLYPEEVALIKLIEAQAKAT